jgi:UDP-2,3-diacylglucosamine pyrophosphatase LpxH
MNTYLISDLHLGARNSRADLLAALLEEDFDRLILNGDTVDRPEPGRFRPEDWQVVRLLRKIARERELVVVRGNHDRLPSPGNPRGTTRVLSELLGAEVVEQFALDVGGERYLVIHGDLFDRTMNLTWVGDVADWCYRGIQRVSRSSAQWVKGASKHLCGVVASVQRGALQQARAQGYSGVITGHTHFCHDEAIEGLHYLNTGCWVDWPCTYVRADENGARLLHWDQAQQHVAQLKPSLVTAVN